MEPLILAASAATFFVEHFITGAIEGFGADSRKSLEKLGNLIMSKTGQDQSKLTNKEFIKQLILADNELQQALTPLVSQLTEGRDQNNHQSSQSFDRGIGIGSLNIENIQGGNVNFGQQKIDSINIEKFRTDP
jgi:hypothetical protein